MEAFAKLPIGKLMRECATRTVVCRDVYSALNLRTTNTARIGLPLIDGLFIAENKSFNDFQRSDNLARLGLSSFGLLLLYHGKDCEFVSNQRDWS
jgi:hypothetical protein